MAATRPMAHQQNNKKHGNLAQECFTDGMVDHEMHLKMSKKLAQLTQVSINISILLGWSGCDSWHLTDGSLVLLLYWSG